LCDARGVGIVGGRVMDKADWLPIQMSLPRSTTEDEAPNPIRKNAALRCFTSVRQLGARIEASLGAIENAQLKKKGLISKKKKRV
jgi:hypothetical protein